MTASVRIHSAYRRLKAREKGVDLTAEEFFRPPAPASEPPESAA